MKREKFGNRLVAGMEEGLDALKSNTPLPMMWRPSMPKPPVLAGRHSVKNIRQSFGLTQDEFSKLMMVSTKTLQSWEQGTRKPSGSARRILQILENPNALDSIIQYRIEKMRREQTGLE